MQAHGSACIQEYSGTFCMHSATIWNFLHAFWNILEHSACILEHSPCILEHSGTFCMHFGTFCMHPGTFFMHSGTFFMHSKTFWNILFNLSTHWLTDTKTLGLLSCFFAAKKEIKFIINYWWVDDKTKYCKSIHICMQNMSYENLYDTRTHWKTALECSWNA